MPRGCAPPIGRSSTPDRRCWWLTLASGRVRAYAGVRGAIVAAFNEPMGTPHSTVADVTVIGAGIAGAACAVVLRDAGVTVRVLERGRAPGGRLASPQLHGRRVDLGAGYFTVRDDGFAEVVRRWSTARLAREWTDTFSLLAPGEQPTSKTGPMRWATPAGLRSLVRELLGDIDVRTAEEADQLPAGTVALAMPDPQAARLVPVPDAVAYDPVIAVACGFTERGWTFADAAFVHDDARIGFLADDGARRGDGAPVLVAHSTSELAAEHLAEPDGAIAPVVAALRELVDVPAPDWTAAHRWSLAKPASQHDQTYALIEVSGQRVGLAGDQWCPEGSPRVESAWRSGTDLGHALVAAR